MNTKRKAARRLERDAVIDLSQRRLWYADEPSTAQPTPQAPAPEPEKASGAVDSGVEDKPKSFDEGYVKELRAENADWRKKTRDLEKRLKEIEDAQTQKHDAELKEQAKWQELAEKRESELKQLQADLATERLNGIRMRVGSELKLPPALVARLQGATEDEIRADATALAKELGLDKPAETTQQARSQNTTTAAPGGQPVGRTDATRKGEYFGGANTSPIFQGGGVVINGNQD